MKDVNPYRRIKIEEAEFEYIPLLPLAWRVNSSPDCSYQSLINDILEYMKSIQTGNSTSSIKKQAPKFSIASTYNLRTEMGKGMPTPFRKGDAYTTVSEFVMSLSIGHYERWPQCPDLLRKSWKYIVELPYVTPSKAIPIDLKPSETKGRHQNIEKIKKTTFYFSGSFDLFGPESVCSVRHALLLLANRTDTILLNTTHYDTSHPFDGRISSIQSDFCLITKSDSYSSSFFYASIQSDCLPIVISDWYVFSYPWFIEYQSFVIRINELDFVKNPHYVLDYIKRVIGSNPAQLQTMKTAMRSAQPYLRYDPISRQSASYSQFIQSFEKIHSMTSSSSSSSDPSKAFWTILPIELFLLELRYAQQPGRWYENIPCLRPFLCMNHYTSHASNQSSSIVHPHPLLSRSIPYTIDKVNKKRQTIQSEFNSAALNNTYYVLQNNYQVDFLFLPKLTDLRNHLCKHIQRLIGSYKIVYFMQCVRILWPLQPGQFRPVDRVDQMSNSQSITNGISSEDHLYVVYFHNVSMRPKGYVMPSLYPIVTLNGNSSKMWTINDL